MKSIIKVLLITVLLLLLAPMTAFAGILVLADGAPLDSQSEPITISGKLMVPMRSIFECLGAQVSYDNGKITALLGKTEIKLTVNQLQCQINNRPDFLPVAPVVFYNGNTMVPLRFVSQALNADVEYLNEHQLVLITSPAYRDGLKSDDRDFLAKVKEYNSYKNLTMTNEKSIAMYGAIKDSVSQNIENLFKYNQMIKEPLLQEQAKTLALAIEGVNGLKGMQESINQLSAELARDTLTIQLSKEIKNYYAKLTYVYDLLIKEKEIGSLSKEKFQEAMDAEQKMIVEAFKIEEKIKTDLEQSRRGVN